MTNLNEELFTKSDKEYAKLDKLTKLYRELFDTLKAMESIGLYGTEKWAETFTKYSETFKKVNGYKPHWAR